MTLCFAASLLGVGACATPAADTAGSGAERPALLTYAPGEIIAGTRNTGSFLIADGCVVFERVRPANSRSPALFPPGSAWVDGSAAIRLPNGQTIRIGRTVEVAYEAPPAAGGTAPGCAGDPIHILNLVGKEK
ncbi:MAG: hypothetical protein ACK40O_08510 [Allosphingosinicella sp.]